MEKVIYILMELTLAIGAGFVTFFIATTQTPIFRLIAIMPAIITCFLFWFAWDIYWKD